MANLWEGDVAHEVPPFRDDDRVPFMSASDTATKISNSTMKTPAKQHIHEKQLKEKSSKKTDYETRNDQRIDGLIANLRSNEPNHTYEGLSVADFIARMRFPVNAKTRANIHLPPKETQKMTLDKFNKKMKQRTEFDQIDASLHSKHAPLPGEYSKEMETRNQILQKMKRDLASTKKKVAKPLVNHDPEELIKRDMKKIFRREPVKRSISLTQFVNRDHTTGTGNYNI